MSAFIVHMAQRPAARQRGVVTLAIGIILLLLITLITLYGGRTTILEQRISANDYRQKEASGTAQAGLNYGIEFAKAHQGLMRVDTAGGWFDGTLDIANDNFEWTSTTTDLGDCSAPADDTQQALCDSGLTGEVRFFGTAFDPNDLSTYDVPVDWPASGSGTFDDCPGADCRVALDLVLCEFDVAGDPCEDGQGDTAQYAVLALARGVSEDGTAQSSVRMMIAPFDVLPGNAIPPLMAAANISINGTLDVVVNPDGAGPGTGIPISAWADGDLVMSGNASFCYPDEYFNESGKDILSLPVCDADLGNQPCRSSVSTANGFCEMPVCNDCDCPTSGDSALTKSTASNYLEGIDVVDADGNSGPTPDSTNFPADVFNHIFGVPHENYALIKDTIVPEPDCSNIGPGSSGLHWIEGDCSLSGVAGSPDGPLVIVTEGDFQMQGGGTYFGLVFAFSDPANGIPGGTVNLRGGPEFYGSVVSDHQINISNGNFDLIFSQCMLDRIRNDDLFRRLGPIPGSWADHL